MRSSPSNRVIFLDWLRGVAAIIMLQGHTFDAFVRPESRNSAAFIFSQFIGGEAAAIFLLLTGVTYALGMNRREHLPPWQRVVAALRRARYLILLAVMFRLQAFLFSLPHSSIKDLLKVDVLNTMGVTAAVLSILALRSGMDRIRWAAAAGTLLAVISPIMSALNTAGLPMWLRSYVVPSYDMFGLFPWSAFLAFGVAIGSMIPLIERAAWNRVMQWSAISGFALLLAGRYFADLPFSVYSASEFWLNSPALVACKLGVAFLMGSGAYLWTEHLSSGWSFVRQLGTTSLLVYWVHIELVYGRLLENYRQRLTVGMTIAAAVALVILMVGVSVTVKRTQWRQLARKIGLPVPLRHEPAHIYTLPALDIEAPPAARRRA